ncbi:AraC family transcriptional regulator [Paenibacillus marinisediminis]
MNRGNGMTISNKNNERWVYRHGDHPMLMHMTEFELLGYDHFKTAAPLQIHFHEDAYEFVYIEQGKVSWEVDGVTHHTHAQQLFLTRPGEIHRASFDYIGPCTIWWIIIRNPETHHEWFTLGEAEREEFVHVLKHQPRICSTNRGIVEPFRNLRRVIEQPNSILTAYQVRHYILEILLQLMQSTNSSSQSPDLHQYSVELASRIEANPALRCTNEQLAAEAGLSESHFYRVFRETNGQSPATYMDRVRMECACRMLLESHSTITSVAMDLGFKTSQHFATVFKKYVGMTPRDWRNREGK